MSVTSDYTKSNHPWVAIDIETAPDRDALALALASPPEFVAPRNYKDHAKIEIYLEGEHERWIAATTDKASLDPLTGQVVSIAIAGDDFGEQVVTINDREGEADLIRTVFDDLSNVSGVATFNGLEFDLPFLMLRAARYQVRLPHWLQDGLRRYSTKPHCDVRAVLSSWNPRRKGTLGDWHYHLFNEHLPEATYNGKVVTGALVSRLVKDEAWVALGGYNLIDAQATWRIYKRLAEIQMLGGGR